MAEATKYIKDSKEEGKDVLGFIKKFTKLKPSKAKELREKLELLDIIKIDDKQISKIIDLLPEKEEELNKTFVGINLDEEESKKILGVIKEFK